MIVSCTKYEQSSSARFLNGDQGSNFTYTKQPIEADRPTLSHWHEACDILSGLAGSGAAA
jgi:hypothetical protein